MRVSLGRVGSSPAVGAGWKPGVAAVMRDWGERGEAQVGTAARGFRGDRSGDARLALGLWFLPLFLFLVEWGPVQRALGDPASAGGLD